MFKMKPSYLKVYLHHPKHNIQTQKQWAWRISENLPELIKARKSVDMNDTNSRFYHFYLYSDHVKIEWRWITRLYRKPLHHLLYFSLSHPQKNASLKHYWSTEITRGKKYVTGQMSSCAATTPDVQQLISFSPCIMFALCFPWLLPTLPKQWKPSALACLNNHRPPFYLFT